MTPPATWPAVAAYAVFAVASVWLTVVDLKTHRLPNRIVLPLYPILLALLTLASLATGEWGRLLDAVLGGVVLFFVYAVLRSVTGGVGGGDVKLAGAVGLCLGYAGWPAVVVGTAAAFLLGGIAALTLLVARRATRSTRIAFGPFLLGGAWLVLAASAAHALHAAHWT